MYSVMCKPKWFLSNIVCLRVTQMALTLPLSVPVGCGANNGGCQHECRFNRRGVRCRCRDGYRLNQDRRTCRDVDECRRNNGGCSDQCTNTDGSFICSCLDGQLQADQLTCSSDSNENQQQQTCAFNNGGCQQVGCCSPVSL